MAELLKYIYNDSFFKTYADALEEVLPSFDRRRFMEAFGTPHWASLELKQRMAYLTHITQKWLPTGLQHKVAAILELITLLRAQRHTKPESGVYLDRRYHHRIRDRRSGHLSQP